jgi:chaperone required for assembly of F1-ATPase
VKRFWVEVSLSEQNGASIILLDGKPMRLPGGAVLHLPAGALADAIAAEWRSAGGGQGGVVSPESLPLTRLAGTAIQRIAPNPGPTIDAIAGYGQTDLLCYRADSPPELAARQAMLWQPWLAWSADHLGARLIASPGVMPHPQPAQSLARLQDIVAAATPWELAGLGIIVPALGSLVLGLAVAKGRLKPETAHELALLDELFEAEAWGVDTAAERRRQAILQEIIDAARFMLLAAG